MLKNNEHQLSHLNIDEDGNAIRAAGAMKDITAETERTAYIHAEFKKLAANLQKLAQGNTKIDTTVGRASQYTQEEYEEFMKIASNMEHVRKSMDSGETFKEKAHWYEFMLDSIYETPISATDMDKKITFLNKAGLDILGKTRQEVTGKPCAEVWNLDICKNENCGIECMIREEGHSVFNIDNSTYTSRASYIKDLAGINIGHVEVVNDVTETINKEYELIQLQTILYETNNVIEFDDEGTITDINQNLLDIWNVESEEFVGKHYSSLVGLEKYKLVWNDMKHGKIHEDIRHITTQGKTATFRHKFMPICKNDGNLLRVIMVAIRIDDEVNI